MSKPDFVPTTFKPNRKKAVKKLQSLCFNSKINPVDFRKRLHKALYTSFLPNRVECRQHKAEETPYDELVPQVFIRHRIVFYVHGGSFVAGSAECWRPFCALLANVCSARVELPDYRLAPSYAFPSPLEDIQRVFRDVYARETASSRAEGSMPPEFVIAADGSGASLAFALIFNLKEHVRQTIKQILLFSPWLDISTDALVFAQKKNADEILTSEGIRACTELYTYAANIKNPLVSPVYAADESFKNFPPVYIQMGEQEILLPDVQKFCGRLEEMSVEHVLDIERGLFHMFQMADEYLEESHRAVDRIGKAVKARCSNNTE
jgi:acetyl esterase/lipase